MISELVYDEMNYVYRVVFSYVGNPKKFPVPFVRFKPKEAIFSFKKVLDLREKSIIKKIGEDLNQALGYPVKMQEQFYVNDSWTNQPTDTIIEKPSINK